MHFLCDQPHPEMSVNRITFDNCYCLWNKTFHLRAEWFSPLVLAAEDSNLRLDDGCLNNVIRRLQHGLFIDSELVTNHQRSSLSTLCVSIIARIRFAKPN